MPERYLTKQNWKYGAIISISLFLIFSFCCIVIPGKPFYEDSNYLYYLISFIQDFDFNILNQVPDEASWLVTKNLFHPDIHSEIQTPFLLSLYVIESFAQFFSKPDSMILFYLSSFMLHIVSLSFGIYYCIKIGELLGFRVSRLHFSLFLFSTSLFYFSFLYFNLIEIFCFPLLSYVLFCLVSMRAQTRSVNPIALALAVGVLLSIKITYVFITVYTAVIFLHFSIKNRSYKDLTLFLIPLSLYLGLNNYNLYFKLGTFISYANSFRYILDINLKNAVSTLIFGYWGKKGLFSSNPSFTISIIGLALLLKHSLGNKKINQLDAAMLLGWFSFSFFQLLFLIGDTLEDHLVGRTFLTALPLLFLGFSYVFSLKKTPHIKLALKIVVPVFIVWNLFMTAIFILNCLVSHYAYASPNLWDPEIIGQGYRFFTLSLSDNLDLYIQNITYIVLFFVIIFLLTSLFCNKNYSKRKFFEKYLVIHVAMYFTMICFNLYYAPKHIDKYVKEGVYQNKVIGDGNEIFIFDLMLDILRVLHQNGNQEQKALVDLRTQQYYSDIEKQVVKSTPDFDLVLKNKSRESSVYSKRDLKENDSP